jgi:hypothetical protein
MNEVAQEIGRRIRLWRTATPPPKTRRKNQGETGWRPHMTIEELAKATGLTVTTVNKLELGYKAPASSRCCCSPRPSAVTRPSCSPAPSRKGGAKAELLDELNAVAAQLSPKQIRELVKSARGMEPG